MTESRKRALSPNERRHVGQAGEAIAEAHLLQLPGWEILARNVYFRAGELDIVAMDGRTLVFVEVRGRWSQGGLRAEDSVTRLKQRKLSRAACLWLQRHPSFQRVASRFDVVSIDLRTKQIRAHHRNAFEAVL